MELKSGFAIRWWETVIDAGGNKSRTMKYEKLKAGTSKRDAEAKLGERLLAARQTVLPPPPVIPTFSELADRFERDLLSMQKMSTRMGRKTILDVHLIPRFGPTRISELSTADFQRFFTELRETGYQSGNRREEYSAHTLHDIRGVLRVVLNAGLEWYRQPADPRTGVPFNPVEGIRLPKLKVKNKKWRLSAEQAGQLLGQLTGKAKVMAALAITTGMRRGEILALRLCDVAVATVGDRRFGRITVSQASYLGSIDTPKTEAGLRTIDVHPWVLELIQDWVSRARKRKPEDLVFGTRTNRLENSNNILRRHVFPACDAIGVPHASWLTFRRTFQSLAHSAGIPARAIADIVGHSDVETQFIYIQSEDETRREAIDRVGNQLCEIVRNPKNETTVVH